MTYNYKKSRDKLIYYIEKAISCNYNINEYTTPISFSKKNNSYYINSKKWTNYLGAVLLYNIPSEKINKIKYVADILNVHPFWLRAIQSQSVWNWNRVPKYLIDISKKSSKLGIQVNDGFELGEILNNSYLIEYILNFNGKLISNELFNTHSWEEHDSTIKAKEFGIKPLQTILKCNVCNILSSTFRNKYKTFETLNYIELNKTDELSCKERVIKSLLV